MTRREQRGLGRCGLWDELLAARRRTTIGEEVDFVIAARGRLLPAEVKASGRPRLGDARHLRTFRAEYGRKARAGLLLHTGKTIEWIASDLPAVPWWCVI